MRITKEYEYESPFNESRLISTHSMHIRLFVSVEYGVLTILLNPRFCSDLYYKNLKKYFPIVLDTILNISCIRYYCIAVA